MSVIDVQKLLEPCPVEAPAGEDLEYDPSFLEVFRLAEGTPERVMGSTVVPAEPPDWRKVQERCTELLARSKDLRIAILLLRALVYRESLTGLQSGTELLAGLVDQYWDSLFPLLDADANNDPMERMNVLASLIDPDLMLLPLRTAPLVQSPVFGTLSLRKIEIAEGKTSAAPNEDALDAASVNAAFTDCALDELAASADATASSLDNVRRLTGTLEQHVQGADIPDFKPLQTLLSEILTVLQSHLRERQPTSPPELDDATETATPRTPGPSGRTGDAATLDPSHISSREDVVRVLDALCLYYKRHEPSSPVPLLLERARRLATKDFMEIMHDLVPEALDKLVMIKGPGDDKS
ncbi:type VI secretion system protein TssA [Thiohalocapsa marina]|uniref:Type VI secretion system protein TssA n=1 Tax=Thiohalocapsa marina TaxID=424902 RepID=A0A5M8FUA8_9GAMM|nr:type VI secretion system protein TssA [Thiohalocapsa marina]KAA6187375.1 type VI secretion system protein TssA [Thiohalocapsa marina]